MVSERLGCQDPGAFVGLWANDEFGANPDEFFDWRDFDEDISACISFSGTGDGSLAVGGALDDSFQFIRGCPAVCSGARPQVSRAANDGFRFDFADSIELKLDVRWCTPCFGTSPLVERCLGGLSAVGGSMETVLGRISGLIICDAPFLYDR